MSSRVAVIGHVDHGKSTLCGHLMHLTGNVEPHVVESLRNEQGKTIWSRVLDIYEEERIRSKTHEFSIAELQVDGFVLSLVDTPGHKTYIRSMIDGISQQVDAAIVIVSAAGDEFTKAFTKGTLKEDIILARCAEITRFIVAINKIDTLAADSPVVEDVVKKLSVFFKSLGITTVQYIPVSGITGAGLVEGVTWAGTSYQSLLSQLLVPAESRPTREWFTTSEIPATLRVIQCENIIAAGFPCFMHHVSPQGSHETEVMLSRVSVKGKPFCKVRDTAQVTIQAPHEVTVYVGQMLIVRKDEYTIGYAKVTVPQQ